MPWTRLQFPYLLLNREARLFIGTGAYGRLLVMKEVEQEAERREVELVILPTAKAIEALSKNAKGTSAILHVTC